jgi:hypothetical protein
VAAVPGTDDATDPTDPDADDPEDEHDVARPATTAMMTSAPESLPVR